MKFTAETWERGKPHLSHRPEYYQKPISKQLGHLRPRVPQPGSIKRLCEGSDFSLTFVCQLEDCCRQMAKTKQTARKTNTLGMSTYQDDSTSPSSSGEEVDTDAEESRQKGDKLRYNQPIFTGGEGKVTQAPEGGRIKRKVILEYSSDEVSESQLDQLISPEYPTAEDVAKIKKTKKSVK